MNILVRVIGIRYAYRAESDEEGPGTDGIVILQEVGGDRHGAVQFNDALGTDLLQAQHQNPGEPVIAHELFLDILRLGGIGIEGLTLGSIGDGGTRPGVIAFKQGDRSWSRAASAYDVVGFAIASHIPISIDRELFAKMHAVAPPLKRMLGGSGTDATEFAERLALTEDRTKLGNA